LGILKVQRNRIALAGGRKRVLKIAAAVSVCLAGCAAASADDLPAVSHAKGPGYVDPDASGFYLWSGSDYQSINLPRYNLGPSTQVGTAAAYGSQIVNLDPHATGYGLSGGLGYALPFGTLPAWLGQNIRVEFSGSYVDATARTNGSAQYPTPSGGGANFILLNNTNVFPTNYGCIGLCNTASALSSNYSSWQINGKIVSDFAFGAFILSPSLAAFGGISRNDQSLSLINNNGFSPSFLDSYVANTQLRWTDAGLRAGLKATIDVTKAVKIGFGGSVGVADRNVQLAGNDLYVSLGGAPYSLGSTIGVSTARAALLANLEASLEFRPWRNVALRTFAGLNFDNSVPGIQAPSYNTTSIIPGSINFQNETSYYAGGGVKVSFAP
jgi:hypothetical protein